MGEQLIELDSRRRATLKAGRHERYLVREFADGTLVMEPAVVITEAERRMSDRHDIMAHVESARRHPEDATPYVRRTERSG